MAVISQIARWFEALQRKPRAFRVAYGDHTRVNIGYERAPVIVFTPFVESAFLLVGEPRGENIETIRPKRHKPFFRFPTTGTITTADSRIDKFPASQVS